MRFRPSRRPFLLAVVGSLLACVAVARRMPVWNYQDLLAKSDLVVIAQPLSSAPAADRIDLPGIFLQPPGEAKKPIPAVGVETRFAVEAVIKGPRQTKQFTLLHYRLADPALARDTADSDGSVQQGFLGGGPLLVDFPAGDGRTYLLFLVREKDGRYAPTTGQTDPAMYSIHPLEGQPWHKPSREKVKPSAANRAG